MLRGKLQGIDFTLKFGPFEISCKDPDLKDLLEDLDRVIYDPHQGIRLASIQEDEGLAMLILNDLSAAFGLDLEISEGPDLGEEEHIIVRM